MKRNEIYFSFVSMSTSNCDEYQTIEEKGRSMRRREFIKGLGAGTALAGLGGAKLADAKPQFKWKMVTTWPKNFPGLGTGANNLAKLITAMSGGRIQVKVYGAKELVPPFEVFDAVSRGTAEMGHGAAITGKARVRPHSFLQPYLLG